MLGKEFMRQSADVEVSIILAGPSKRNLEVLINSKDFLMVSVMPYPLCALVSEWLFGRWLLE